VLSPFAEAIWLGFSSINFRFNRWKVTEIHKSSFSSLHHLYASDNSVNYLTRIYISVVLLGGVDDGLNVRVSRIHVKCQHILPSRKFTILWSHLLHVMCYILNVKYFIVYEVNFNLQSGHIPTIIYFLLKSKNIYIFYNLLSRCTWVHYTYSYW